MPNLTRSGVQAALMAALFGWLITSEVRAADLYDPHGHVAIAGTGDARTIGDWCDLAIGAKSEESRGKYETTLTLIERAAKDGKTPDGPRDRFTRTGLRDKGLMTTYGIESTATFHVTLPASDMVSLRKAGLAGVKAASHNSRMNGIAILIPVADESCLPPLFSCLRASNGDGAHEDEANAAAILISHIGGKEAISGLVLIAKTKIGSGTAGFVAQKRSLAAIEALGHIGSPEAGVALKGVQRFFSRATTDPKVDKAIENAMNVNGELQASDADAKALAKKPGK